MDALDSHLAVIRYFQDAHRAYLLLGFGAWLCLVGWLMWLCALGSPWGVLDWVGVGSFVGGLLLSGWAFWLRSRCAY
jgi:hypothetical protein